MGNPQKPRLVIECDENFTEEFKQDCIIRAKQERTNLKVIVKRLLDKWLESFD